MHTSHGKFHYTVRNTQLQWSVIYILILFLSSFAGTVPELTDGDNFTVQAIPWRPNGLLIAMVNNTDLVYAIGTREGKVMSNVVYIVITSS